MIDADAARALVRPATSLDVARRAGVSRSTVSNILNGNDARFSEQTCERVRRAAKELDYRPSLAARSLVSGRSETVVVLLPHTTFGSNLQDAVDQVVEGTRQVGANVVVRFAGPTFHSTEAAILALRPMALVDFGVLGIEDHVRLEDRGIIVVPSERASGGRSVDGGITELQAELLLERGPRSLWFAALSDARLDPYGPGRYAALRSYCVERGIAQPTQVRVPLSTDAAVEALSTIVAAGLPAGVACYNDDVALALLAAARRLGIRIPEDVAVVGVDHTPVGQLWEPALTTIDTDMRAFVAALADDLRARLSGDASVAAPPGGYLQIAVVRGATT